MAKTEAKPKGKTKKATPKVTAPPILNVKPEVVTATSLIPHPQNPRRGDIDAVRTSIREHGFWGLVVAQQSTRHILVGNQRWEAAQEEGIHEIPVMWVDVDDDMALRILLADNKLAERAEWDFETLAALLRAWDDAGVDITALGWEEWEIEPLLAADWTPPVETDEEFLPQERPQADPTQATVVLSERQYKLLAEVRRRMQSKKEELEDGEVIERLCEAWLDENA